MNSRKNHVKRVAAGALAVLTVAAYAAPVANVGGLPSKILTANAEETTTQKLTFGANSVFVTSVVDAGINKTYSDFATTGATFVTLTEGKNATINTTAPFAFTVGTTVNATNNCVKITSNADIAKAYDANTKKINAGYMAEKSGTYFVADDAIDTDFLADYTFYKIFDLAKDYNFTETGSADSGYQYKFKVPEAAITMTAKTTAFTIYNYTTEDEWGPTKGQADAKKFKGVATIDYDCAVSTDGTAASAATAANAGTPVRNEEITLKSKDAFKIHVWDEVPGTDVITYESKYDSEKKKFTVTFNAKDAEKTTVCVEGVTPTYNYSISSDGTKLLATDTAYGTANNTPVASVTAKAQVWNKITNKLGDAEDLATNGSAINNGSKVTLSLTRDTEHTMASGSVNSTIKITKNGTELKSTDTPLDGAATTYAQIIAAASADATGASIPAYTFSAPGAYEVTYTVYARTLAADGITEVAIPQLLTYKFEIATQDKLTKDNVKLIVTPPAGVKLRQADGTFTNTPVTINGVKDSVAEIEIEGEKLDGKTINVTAELYKDAGFTDKQTATITGSLKTSILGEEETIYVTYENAEYSNTAETIPVKYKVVAEKKDVTIAVTGGQITASIDEIKNLKDYVLDQLTVENGDKSNISFEYVVGKGAALNTEELDWHESGLPSEEGEYSLYILYNGEAKQVTNLTINKHSLYAAPTAAQTTMTYGDAFMAKDTLSYVDSNGKTIKKAEVTDLTIQINNVILIPENDAKIYVVDGLYYPTPNDFVNKTNGVPVYIFDGKTYRKGAQLATNHDEIVAGTKALPAGNYIVSITGGKTDKEGYGVGARDYAVSVAKKQITADMILIEPMTYQKGVTKTLANANIKCVDTAVNKAFTGETGAVTLKLAGGETTGIEAKKYTAQVAVDETNAYSKANYEGIVKSDWYIVKGATQENQTGLAWDDKATTIYDNGSIHVEFSRPANTSYTSKVDHFGVVYEKEGKLAAPDFSSTTDTTITGLTGTTATEKYISAKKSLYKKNSINTQVVAAYKSLVFGGSITCVDQPAEMASKLGEKNFGANFNVVNTDTGIWARPYVVLEDGRVYYGEVRYLNLVQEATDKLNLAPTGQGGVNNNYSVNEFAVTKDFAKENSTAAQIKDKTFRQQIKAGYSPEKGMFYVYGSYSIDADSNVKANAIQRFGVIVDKKGTIAEGDTDVAKKLLVDKGFIQGLAQKDNDKMDEDEFGAVIAPKDAVTGVWLRTFVDFGNGLVVYTEPVYIKSVSKQYTAGVPALNAIAKVVAGTKSNLNVPVVAAPKYNNKTVTLKQVGVIVDKSGSLLEKNKATGAYTIDGTTYKTIDNANASLILENAEKNGYIKGKKTSDLTNAYTAKVTPSLDSKDAPIPIVARPYAVYEINGKEVTIYGDITVSKNA